MNMLEQYEQGSDITIMNCFYQYGTRDPETNKSLDDFLVVVYKDNQTGIKNHEIIHKPNYTFYKTKPGIELDHNLLFIEKDKVEPVTARYSKLEKTIAEITGNMDFYNQCVSNKNMYETKRLHAIPEIFNSDMSIEDHYRLEFSKKYMNNIEKISKAFFDIEVDIRYCAGDFVQMGECPINAISFLDEKHDIIHSFLLRNPNNPLIQQFEDSITNGQFGYKEIIKFVTDAIGGEKQLKRYHLDKTKFDIRFYDNELEMLSCFFGKVHEYDPDFVLSWNGSAFDLEYIIARIYALGAEPADIMCDQSWDIRLVKNYVDQRNLSTLPERGDYTFISGNTVWIDQMIQYASRRKSKYGSMKSTKLDDIGYLTAKVKKLNYHHITNDIGMLPWLNFMIFALYNIFDVIVQKCIETKCQDLEYLFAKCIVNNTSYKKGHRQTVYLINRMAKEFDKLGYVIGNNVNRWNEKPDKFLGALVGNPLNTNDFAKMIINGVPISIAESLQDYDYKSLYPSIALENNIAPNTQVGRIMIDKKVYENENAYLNEKYSRGGEFIENLVCDNNIVFCKRWLHLAGVMEFLEDMQEFYEKYRISYTSSKFYGEYAVIGTKILIAPIVDCRDMKVIKPFTFENNSSVKPILFLNGRNKLEVIN